MWNATQSGLTHHDVTRPLTASVVRTMVPHRHGGRATPKSNLIQLWLHQFPMLEHNSQQVRHNAVILQTVCAQCMMHRDRQSGKRGIYTERGRNGGRHRGVGLCVGMCGWVLKRRPCLPACHTACHAAQSLTTLERPLEGQAKRRKRSSVLRCTGHFRFPVPAVLRLPRGGFTSKLGPEQQELVSSTQTAAMQRRALMATAAAAAAGAAPTVAAAPAVGAAAAAAAAYEVLTLRRLASTSTLAVGVSQVVPDKSSSNSSSSYRSSSSSSGIGGGDKALGSDELSDAVLEARERIFGPSASASVSAGGSDRGRVPAALLRPLKGAELATWYFMAPQPSLPGFHDEERA
eukprot:210594-Chlamydomonas_euryale.AAC.3